LSKRFTFHDVIVTVAAQIQAPLVQVGNTIGSKVAVKPPGVPSAFGGLQVALIGAAEPPAQDKPRQDDPGVANSWLEIIK
jgi:hypothetical protein